MTALAGVETGHPGFDFSPCRRPRPRPDASIGSSHNPGCRAIFMPSAEAKVVLVDRALSAGAGKRPTPTPAALSDGTSPHVEYEAPSEFVRRLIRNRMLESGGGDGVAYSDVQRADRAQFGHGIAALVSDSACDGVAKAR